MRVLVVDEDLRTARRFARMLEEDGYEVEVVGDGREALSRLDVGPPPDVLVTELLMKSANGLALMDRARSTQPELPVVFVTDHPELIGHLRGGEPAPRVFTKPLAYAEFQALLAELGRERDER